MTTKDSRIYAVTHKPTGQVRLVRAKSTTGAQTYVVGNSYECRQATQDDIVEFAVKRGVQVEDSAPAAPPVPPPPPPPPAGATGLVIQPASFDPSAPNA